MRTVTGGPNAARRKPENMAPEERQAVERAARAVKSKSGKAFLKKRGEKVERSFAHVLDCGGLRRTVLRGLENINKRYLCGIIAFNLSLIMRKLTGPGTPRQTAAARLLLALLAGLFRSVIKLILTPLRPEMPGPSPGLFNMTVSRTFTPFPAPSSTGC